MDSKKDSKLKNYLQKPLFLIIIGLILYITYTGLNKNNPDTPQWEIVSTLNERITNEVALIRDLKNTGERVEEINSTYILESSPFDDTLYNKTYCSSNLENKLLEIQNITGVVNFYEDGFSVKKNKKIPIDEMKNYIKINDMKCLTLDNYISENGSNIAFLRLLNSLVDEKKLVFYKKI